MTDIGRWSLELGDAFSHLNSQCRVGDYGALGRISHDEAVICVERARQILKAVHDLNPEVLGVVN
jgi:hypothetical protein